MPTFYVEAHEDWDGLRSEFAYWNWNVLMAGIPYDTGNLRSSFKLKTNTKTRIKYSFDKAEAYYVEFLEEGKGPVTKYKGFIERGLVGATIRELLFFIKTNKNGFIVSKPVVQLRQSAYRNPFQYERKILKYHKEHLTYITGEERKALSRTLYRSLEDKNIKSLGGKKPRTFREYRKSINADLSYYYIDEKDKII